MVAELRYGAEYSANPAAEAVKVETFLAPLVSLPFDDAVAAVYGPIQAKLRRAGMLIGDFDASIAAVALHHNLTVVMYNTAEFSRAAGLSLVDWELP